MKTFNVLSKRFTLPLLIAGVLFVAQLPNAKADYLYWTDAQLGTSSITNGYNFAEQTLRRANASGIRRQSTEVAGTIAGSYVAITVSQPLRGLPPLSWSLDLTNRKWSECETQCAQG